MMDETGKPGEAVAEVLEAVNTKYLIMIIYIDLALTYLLFDIIVKVVV